MDKFLIRPLRENLKLFWVDRRFRDDVTNEACRKIKCVDDMPTYIMHHFMNFLPMNFEFLLYLIASELTRSFLFRFHRGNFAVCTTGW